MRDEKVKKIVREGYAKVAKKDESCCTPTSCGCNTTSTSEEISKRIGYTEGEIKSVPEGANMGLGCGNPVALASLKKGETVLDLGSGGGFDCFLSARRVGENGKVIGVDMTPEMIDKARENVRKGKYNNVEFRLGEIENLPVADATVNVIISNCVINLSENKKRVFEEAYRVLKPKGRLMVSDIVLLRQLPKIIRENVEAYVGCLSGAELKDRYIQMIREAGFHQVKVVQETHFPLEDMANDPTAKAIIKKSELSTAKLKDLGKTVLSVKVSAVKSE